MIQRYNHITELNQCNILTKFWQTIIEFKFLIIYVHMTASLITWSSWILITLMNTVFYPSEKLLTLSLSHIHTYLHTRTHACAHIYIYNYGINDNVHMYIQLSIDKYIFITYILIYLYIQLHKLVIRYNHRIMYLISNYISNVV